MVVQDLIDALYQFPPDTPIMIYEDSNSDTLEILAVDWDEGAMADGDLAGVLLFARRI